ncbi:hypothetical protein SEA_BARTHOLOMEWSD_80 [Streptomyces phage BartholomewSD]|uniref:Uncharacterized protein n=1 Tax=Streptomyces phage Alvy TaxID=2599888 RepID=A0A5J6TQ39_9CAUD|nr:hypothetical protein KGG89_gp14 [Streptomyces phage Alvy]QAX95529.1 hypothetical protein SEA_BARTHOLOMEWSD_80 [Streptomyces phage BartholomewSD]QFG12488.1 hypothetical protein SEA_ALVY_80 [Streptomyces phage Alvy]
MNLFRKFRKSKTPTLTLVSRPTPAPLVVLHDDLNDALAELARVFGDGMTADHTGSGFTCSEADAVARLLALAGYKDEAATWLEGHASGDEGGDSHHVYEDDDDQDGHVMGEDEIAEYVAELAA